MATHHAIISFRKEEDGTCGLMDMIPQGASVESLAAPFSGIASYSFLICSREYRIRSKYLAGWLLTLSAGKYLHRSGTAT